MHIGKVISAALLASVFGGSAVFAARLEINSPAEVPPPGYAGRQYVDSAGCVFVRAGSGSTVNWVARVDRNRQHLCGYAPTFSQQTPQVAVAAAPVAPTAPAPAAAVPRASQPLATVAQLTSAPAQGLVARPVVAAVPALVPAPAAAAEPGKYVSPYVARAGQVAAPVPTIVAAAPVANAAAICPNLSPVAQRYTLSDGRHVVRCGPQTEDPVGYINRAGVPGLQVAGMAAAAVSAAVPASLAAVSAAPIPVPQGYRSAWQDDRLNPYRALGTAQGAAQMAQVWTNDVPARLVSVPVAVAASGRTTVSSKSVPAAAAVPVARAQPAAQAPAGRFVQVGTFGVASNADAARARLRSLGLPVASAQVVQGGRHMQIVYAGPFNATDAARAALGKARGAGFGDAVIR